MADTKATALTENTDPIETDLLYTVDDPGGSPASRKSTLLNATAGALLASQLVNEIKGWPPCVKNDADLDALNLWWDKVGTPSTAPTVVDVAGESITETYELCLKVVTDAASEGLSQTWTYADEPRVKSGRVISALLAIWSVSSVSVTAKLVNSDASETAASAVTAAAWTIVEIKNHTLAGTSCNLQVTAAAAGTFYVVPLGVNIGSRAFNLPPRPIVFKETSAADVNLVNGVDPGASWTDVDCTSSTSPLALMVSISAYYTNSTAVKSLSVRRNGSSLTYTAQFLQNVSTSVGARGAVIVGVDDGQIFEYLGSDVAANTEAVYIDLRGWWEWA